MEEPDKAPIVIHEIDAPHAHAFDGEDTKSEQFLLSEISLRNLSRWMSAPLSSGEWE